MNADFPLLIKTLLTAPLQAVPDQQIISDGLGHFTYRDFPKGCTGWQALCLMPVSGRGLWSVSWIGTRTAIWSVFLLCR